MEVIVKKQKNKIIKIIIISTIIAIISMTILLYIYNANARNFIDKYILRKEISEEKLVQIDISEKDNPYFFAYEDKILVLTNNTLYAYETSGNISYTINIEITIPIFKANDKYLCIAEKGGKKVYVISNENILWQKETEYPINNMEINKKGFVSISTIGTSYKIIEVYNNKGEEQIKTYLSNTNVVSMALSEDTKTLAIGEINFSGTLVKSNIKIVDMESVKQNNQQNSFVNYSLPEGVLLTKIKYVDDILVCMCENAIYKIENQQVNEMVNFSNENILFATIEENVMLVKKVKSNLLSSEIEIVIMDVKNNKKNTYKLEREPKSIYAYKNLIAANTGSELIIINDLGWLTRKYISTHEINNIILTNKIVGVIYKSKIGIIQL